MLKATDLSEEDVVSVIDCLNSEDGLSSAVAFVQQKFFQCTRDEAIEVVDLIASNQPEGPMGNRIGAGRIPCKYCGQKDCNFSCDESQAGGFAKCPACGKVGPDGNGCPTCPGFWYTTEAVNTEDSERFDGLG